MGWGGGGLSWLLRTSCASSALQLQVLGAENGGKGWGSAPAPADLCAPHAQPGHTSWVEGPCVGATASKLLTKPARTLPATLTRWQIAAPVGSGGSWQGPAKQGQWQYSQWPFSTPLAAEIHLGDAQQLCPLPSLRACF